MYKEQFVPIEGLRAYLAVWVAIGHGLQTAGFLSLPGPLKFLLAGDEAVNVFIILSGFVITHMVVTSDERYPQYIARRFFRLFPAYVVACVACFFVLEPWARLSEAVPWATSPGWPAYASSVAEIARESTSNARPHLLLHALMLHGLVPMEILPRAAMTFLPAAWSISLEWQFYLIAPFVVRAARRAATLIPALLLFAAALWLYRRGVFGSYPVASFLLASSGYFAIGIASRLGFDALRGLRAGSPLRLSALCVFLLFCFAPERLALFVWLPFLLFLANPDREHLAGRLVQAVLSNRVVTAVGKSSYSLYLVHRPLQVLFAIGALALAPDISRVAMFCAELLAIVVAIAASRLLWRWIEVPGQRLGSRISARYRVPAVRPA